MRVLLSSLGMGKYIAYRPEQRTVSGWQPEIAGRGMEARVKEGRRQGLSVGGKTPQNPNQFLADQVRLCPFPISSH